MKPHEVDTLESSGARWRGLYKGTDTPERFRVTSAGPVRRPAAAWGSDRRPHAALAEGREGVTELTGSSGGWGDALPDKKVIRLG